MAEDPNQDNQASEKNGLNLFGMVRNYCHLIQMVHILLSCVQETFFKQEPL